MQRSNPPHMCFATRLKRAGAVTAARLTFDWPRSFLPVAESNVPCEKAYAVRRRLFREGLLVRDYQLRNREVVVYICLVLSALESSIERLLGAIERYRINVKGKCLLLIY